MRRTALLLGAGAMAVVVAMAGGAAWAAGDAPAWRPIYDVSMKWINFFILAVLLVRFGRAPLMNFLNARRAEMAAALDELETKKAAALQRVEETQNLLDQSNERFIRLTERIVTQGEARKAALIEAAGHEGRMILESGKRKIANQLLQARQGLKNELVDAAFAAAMEKLAGEMTAADDQRLLERYMDSL